MSPLGFEGSPSFLGLPLEIRLEIYRLVFRGAGLDYRTTEATDAPPHDVPAAILLTPIEERGLLCTNRQTRWEALSSFYHMCELTLHGEAWSPWRIRALLPQLLVQTARIVHCKHIHAPMLTRPSVFPSLMWFRLPNFAVRFAVREGNIKDVKLEDEFWRVWKVSGQETTSALWLYGDRVQVMRAVTLVIPISNRVQVFTHKVSSILLNNGYVTGLG